MPTKSTPATVANRAIVLAHRLVLDGGSKLTPAIVAPVRQTLEQLQAIGITDVCVVDGKNADELHAALSEPALLGMKLQVLANQSWRKSSGAALLVAREFLTRETSPCLVLRGDRPLDIESLAELASTDLGAARAVIAIAEAPQGASHLNGEVKVRSDVRRGAGQVVTALGLDLDDHDSVFTGHAMVKPEIAAELERFNNPALEDALMAWVASGRVVASRSRMTWTWALPVAAAMDEKVAAILNAKSHPAYTLLNPGPVNTTPAVKSALVHHDVCHRDANFCELMVSLTGKLRRVFRGGPDHTVAVITGSGTSAMECAIASVVPRDGKILIIDNGAFGERLHEIARLHEMDIVHLRYAWGDQVDPADVERAFEQYADIAAVAMIHHETSVGLLNPIREVGAIVRREGALLLVDAVSSLGAEDLDVVRDNVDVCWGSANKCLHAISGVGFLCVSPRVWPKIEAVKPRSYYLDLKRYRKYIDDLGQTPFTPAVSGYFALEQACSEFLADGHAARFAMYRQRNAQLRSGVAALGMAPLTRSGNESHSVTTCCVPEGVRFQDLYERLKRRGYIVYACKDVLADRFMQIANMGDLSSDAIDQFLVALAEVIGELRAETGAVAAAHVPPAATAGSSTARASFLARFK